MRQLKSKKAGDEMERVELSHRHTHTARAGASQRGAYHVGQGPEQ